MADFLLTVHVLAAVVWVGGSVLALALGYYLRGRDIETRDRVHALDGVARPALLRAALDRRDHRRTAARGRTGPATSIRRG